MTSFLQYLSEMPYLHSGSYTWEDKTSGFYSPGAIERMFTILKHEKIDEEDFFFLKMKTRRLSVVVTPHGEKFKVVAKVDFKDRLSFKPPPSLKNVMQVKGASTSDKYQAKGLVSKLYAALVHSGYSIASDSEQFIPGKELWKKIAKESAALGLKVHLFDGDKIYTKNGKEVVYNGSNVPDSEIWSSQQDYSGYHKILIAGLST